MIENNIEGKYKGSQTITFFDGININVEEQFLFLEINKVLNTPNTYLLMYTFDNREVIKSLGNIIDGRLVDITPSSVYSNFNLIHDPVRASTSVDDKLVHNFCGIENNIQISGTGILERYC